MGKFKGSKVLVTGFPGFISLHLIERLKKEGARVYAFKKPSLPIKPELKQIIGRGVNIVNCDITHARSVERALSNIKPEIIFHLAAYTSAERESTFLGRSIKVNIQGTANLLSSLEKSKYRSFVNVSSADVYGSSATPFREEGYAKPNSPYGISKLAAEHISIFFHEIYHRPVVNLRLAMIYGEYQPADKIIPFLILSCLRKKDIRLSGGEQTRDFVYARDAVRAMILASGNKKAFGQTFNIASGKEISIKKLALKIVKKTKAPIKIYFGAVPPKRGEIRRMRLETKKAAAVLNWKPKISLEKGLGKMIAWYGGRIRS